MFPLGKGKPGWGKSSAKPDWWPKNVPWANVRMDNRSDEDKAKVRTFFLFICAARCFLNLNVVALCFSECRGVHSFRCFSVIVPISACHDIFTMPTHIVSIINAAMPLVFLYLCPLDCDCCFNCPWTFSPLYKYFECLTTAHPKQAYFPNRYSDVWFFKSISVPPAFHLRLHLP